MTPQQLANFWQQQHAIVLRQYTDLSTQVARMGGLTVGGNVAAFRTGGAQGTTASRNRNRNRSRNRARTGGAQGTLGSTTPRR